MCLYSRLMPNKKYTATKKNGGVIPAVFDNRVLWTPIGCGECIECRKKKEREWKTRLKEEIKQNKTRAVMVNITFTNEEIAELYREFRTNEIDGYLLDNIVASKALRRFYERWRKKYKEPLRHWIISELGQNNTEHLHFHGIVWTNRTNEEIQERWGKGKIVFGKYVNERTINYIVKYVTKKDQLHKAYKPYLSTSDGMGKGYEKTANAKTNKYIEGKTDETYTDRKGFKSPLPIYLRNKIYTEKEREKLWIEKLDKGIKYVLGAECRTDEEYRIALKIAQEKNTKLGYGDGKFNWELRKYEHEQRKLKQKERETNKKYKGKILQRKTPLQETPEDIYVQKNDRTLMLEAIYKTEGMIYEEPTIKDWENLEKRLAEKANAQEWLTSLRAGS